jgi:hypothetical protein
MRSITRILTAPNDAYFAPYSRWQEFLRRHCAEQRRVALPPRPLEMSADFASSNYPVFKGPTTL